METSAQRKQSDRVKDEYEVDGFKWERAFHGKLN